MYVILIKISGSYATGVSLKEVCLRSLMAQGAESSSLMLHASAVCFCNVHSEVCPYIQIFSDIQIGSSYGRYPVCLRFVDLLC